MKTFFGNGLTIAMLLALPLWSLAGTYETRSESFQAQVEAEPGQTLTIANNHWTMKVIGTDENQIRAEAKIAIQTADGDFIDQFFTRAQLKLEPYRSGYKLTFPSPNKAFERHRKTKGGVLNKIWRGNRNFSTSNELTVHIPKLHSLALDNRYGDIEISNVEGDLRIENQSGKVSLDGCAGFLTVNNSYASVAVTQFDGNVEIKSSSGAVEARDILGNLQIENNYRKVRFEHVTGDVVVQAQSSEVRGKGVGGSCDISTSYRPIRLEDVAGNLDIQGSSSAVEVANLQKGVTIETSYRNVVVSDVQGPVTIEGNSSGVTLRRIDGDAQVRTSYRNVDVNRLTGNLKVDASSGAVNLLAVDGDIDVVNSYRDVRIEESGGSIVVRGSSSGIRVSDIKNLPTEAQIRLTTTYRNIDLELPTGIDVTVAAKSQHGKVDSDFPIVTNVNQGKTGKPLVYLKTSHNIDIRAR